MNRNLIDAYEFYTWNGYKSIDVPYIVDVDVSAVTKPKTSNDLSHSRTKVYVGSGEQSFIQMMKDGTLPDGKMMCLTPCVRDEESPDDLHYLVFLKLELIMYNKSWDDYAIFDKEKHQALDIVINSAKRFFEDIIKLKFLKTKLEVIQIDENQFDININDIEVGSYGIRESKYGNYIYGTGLALPRFNLAIMNMEN